MTPLSLYIRESKTNPKLAVFERITETTYDVLEVLTIASAAGYIIYDRSALIRTVLECLLNNVDVNDPLLVELAEENKLTYNDIHHVLTKLFDCYECLSMRPGLFRIDPSRLKPEFLNFKNFYSIENAAVVEYDNYLNEYSKNFFNTDQIAKHGSESKVELMLQLNYMYLFSRYVKDIITQLPRSIWENDIILMIQFDQNIITTAHLKFLFV